MTNVIAILVLAASASIPPNAGRVARAQAQKAADALVRGDFALVVTLTHARVVQGMGGRERMIETLRRGAEEMKEEGNSFDGAEVGEPLQIVRVGDELQCLVPHVLRMRVRGGSLRSRAAMLGFSSDRGRTWRFADASNPTARAHLKEIFPQLSPEIRIPQWEKPVFTPDEPGKANAR